MTTESKHLKNQGRHQCIQGGFYNRYQGLSALLGSHILSPYATQGHGSGLPPPPKDCCPPTQQYFQFRDQKPEVLFKSFPKVVKHFHKGRDTTHRAFGPPPGLRARILRMADLTHFLLQVTFFGYKLKQVFKSCLQQGIKHSQDSIGHAHGKQESSQSRRGKLTSDPDT